MAFKARYPGPCAICNKRIEVGEEITWSRRSERGKRVRHATCPGTAPEVTHEVEFPGSPAPDSIPDFKGESNGNEKDMELVDALEKFVRDASKNAIGKDEIQRIARDEARSIAKSTARGVIETEYPKKAIEVVVRKIDGTKLELGAQHKRFAELLALVSLKQDVYLWGPSQSGKSFAAQMVAKALGLSYYFVSLNPQTPDSRLLGFIRPSGEYQETVFHAAYERGGVLCIDEIDNASSSLLTTLNSALSNGMASFPHGMVTRHADCVIIATGNTPGRGPSAIYPERRVLDGAVCERFAFLHWDYDEGLEETLVLGITPKAKPWLTWVRKVRVFARESGIKVMATPTASMKIAQCIATDTKATDFAETYVLKGLDVTARNKILAANPIPSDIR